MYIYNNYVNRTTYDSELIEFKTLSKETLELKNEDIS